MSPAEALRRCPAGATVIGGSVLLGALETAPLLLYIAFGPADGNPIGLGLLFVASVPLAAAGVVLGLVIVAVQYPWGRRK